jgi:hypothetical protein
MAAKIAPAVPSDVLGLPRWHRQTRALVRHGYSCWPPFYPSFLLDPANGYAAPTTKRSLLLLIGRRNQPQQQQRRNHSTRLLFGDGVLFRVVHDENSDRGVTGVTRLPIITSRISLVRPTIASQILRGLHGGGIDARRITPKNTQKQYTVLHCYCMRWNDKTNHDNSRFCVGMNSE